MGTPIDVRLIHENGVINHPIVRLWKSRNLTNPSTIRFLRAKNAQGYNVYFRPISYNFVIVDDVSTDAFDAMFRDGIRPAAIVETSTENFQVWIMIGDQAAPADAATATRVAKYLASTYGGDLRSARADQLGRLPGLRNRKSKHQQRNGYYPLVMVRRAVWTSPQRMAIDRAFATPLPPSPRSASELDLSESVIMAAPIVEQEARELWEEAIGTLENKFGRLPLDDRSAVDYHVARHFALNGIEPEVAAKIIALNSEKGRERGVDYVHATVAKAYRRKTND